MNKTGLDLGVLDDFSGAVRKTAALKTTPKAAKLQATRWAGETVLDLKQAAAAMQKSVSPIHRKTGQLARALSFKIAAGDSRWKVELGTGLGNVMAKYAHIQDEGGVTHPTVTDRMRRWAWWAFHKMFGAEIKGQGLRGGLRRGAMETYKLGGSKFLAIALTKKTKLDVKVPATHWFTSVVEQREPELAAMMDPETVFNIASQLSGGKG